MEQNFQTSFIPKKPMIEDRAISSRPIGFLTIFCIFIFFAVILVSGGLYFYKGILAKKIISMQNDLELAKGRFEPATITRLKVLDKRLRASSEILSSHITVSPIFEALQAITMKSVRYTKFNYVVGENKKINVKMGGMASWSMGYKAIALQSDLFTTNKNLIDPIFSNLSLDEKGNVNFDLEFSVDPSFVDYKQSLLTKSDDSFNATKTGGEINN